MPTKTQPECSHCGTTEITYVHAAGRGWRRALKRTYCGRCIRRFPSWMQSQF